MNTAQASTNAPARQLSPVKPPGTGTRCATVAVVGRTNAGKSSLVNRIAGDKVSIVSSVVQTTRNVIRGIHTDERGQLVLIDTPGVHKAQSDLGRLMNRMARGAVSDVDIAALILDGSRPPHIEDDGWMRRLLFAENPVVFVLNKCDEASFNASGFRSLWDRILKEKDRQCHSEWIVVSAHSGAGVEHLVARLFELAQPGPLLFAPEIVTDHPRRLAIADVVRENLINLLDDELPHAVGVCVDDIAEQNNTWRIKATLYIERASQRPIILGPKGRLLRTVRRRSEREVSAMFDVDARLDLWIKVSKHWDRNFWILRQMGCAGR